MRKDIMLASPFDEKRFKKWNNLALTQPKLDGLRCRCLFDKKGKATLLSSQGNIIASVPHIIEQLENPKLFNLEIDGELYVHNMSFEQITSIVKRTKNISSDYKLMEYHAFDTINGHPQNRRLNFLYALQLDEAPNIYTVRHKEINSLENLEKTYDEYINQGYEGFIIRHPLAPYERKRSTTIMKHKPKHIDTYKIVGFEEEYSIKGEAKNTLGALRLVASDQETTFSVGTGFTDEQRFTLWQKKGELIGKECTIKYQHLTYARNVPRFPVYVSIEE